MRESLTPKQVARAIGVSEASLKRWCDRGLLPASKTAGGHRRLDVPTVIKFLRESGHHIAEPEILGLPPAIGKGNTVIHRAAEQIRSALELGHEEKFRHHVFNLYIGGHSATDIFDKVIAPAFTNIGKSWEHGTIQIYQERRACEICLRLLHELRMLLPPPSPSAPQAIGGTLSGDGYVLPTTMAEIVLRETGIRAENYGTGIPAATFCAAIRTLKPRLLWLSVSAIQDSAALPGYFRELHNAAQESGAAFVVGGRGLTAELRPQLTYTAYCDTFQHLRSFAVSLLPAPASASQSTA